MATFVAAAFIGACSGTGAVAPPPEATCGPVETEALDAASSLHLLPGAAEPTYRSDPPTSGPHLSGPPPSGALETPIDRPTQVQVLEQGGVVIQYRDLDAAAIDRLEALATDLVVVAPNPGLPAPVVATAWVTKRSCDGVDLEALGAFIVEHQSPAAHRG